MQCFTVKPLINNYKVYRGLIYSIVQQENFMQKTIKIKDLRMRIQAN